MKAIRTAAILAAIAACMTVGSPDAGAWGQKGHDVTCDIAQHHLTARARKQINEIFDANETFENAAENENGDIVRALNAQIAALKSGLRLASVLNDIFK